MVATNAQVQNRRETFLGELTDASLAAIARHGVGGTSVVLEIRLWKRLERVLDRLATEPLSGWENRLAVLARAAYETALEQGIHGPFLDLELAIWDELRRVVRNNRFAPRQAFQLAQDGGHLSHFLSLR